MTFPEDRLKMATALLAAASVSTQREVRALYLASARNVIAETAAEIGVVQRSLERMEAEMVRKPYVGEEGR